MTGGRKGVVVALLVAAALAWIVTGHRMEGMDAGPGTDPGSLGFFAGTWVVMMAAMMLPSTLPMLSTHARLNEQRREAGLAVPRGAGALLAAGYLATWALAGLLAYAAYIGAREAGPGVFAWERAGQYVAAGVVLVAAVYELTPLKDACLRRCREPLMFLIGSWRDGASGAVQMGMLHGGWCVGCCWLLMAALFALGVMSLAWMAVIAVLIAAEKLLPARRLAVGAVTLVLLGLSVAVAVAPSHVPALTIPGGGHGQAMQMGMQR